MGAELAEEVEDLHDEWEPVGEGVGGEVDVVVFDEGDADGAAFGFAEDVLCNEDEDGEDDTEGCFVVED